MNGCIGNHPKVVNSPISNDTLLVHNIERPGRKIWVSKFLLQISINELLNALFSESNIYELKEAIYDTTGKKLISDTSLYALIPKYAKKMTDRYKHIRD